MKTPKLIAIGEALEDRYPSENPPRAQVGGAPLNVAAMAAGLGLDSHFITCLAEDEGSERVMAKIKECGINTDMIEIDPSRVLCHTEVTVAPVTGERQFFFFKENASFLGLKLEDIKSEWFIGCDVFHMGTVCLLDANMIDVQHKAATLAQENGALITLDPNYRPTLFKSEIQTELTKDFIRYAALVKLGEDEFPLVTGREADRRSVESFFASYPSVQALLLTRGSVGMELYLRNGRCLTQRSVRPTSIVDTVGCGDISFGAFVSTLALDGVNGHTDLCSVSDAKYAKALRMAVLAGAEECSRQGALPVPTRDGMEKLAELRGI